jgi:hypothetical protein
MGPQIRLLGHCYPHLLVYLLVRFLPLSSWMRPWWSVRPAPRSRAPARPKFQVSTGARSGARCAQASSLRYQQSSDDDGYKCDGLGIYGGSLHGKLNWGSLREGTVGLVTQVHTDQGIQKVYGMYIFTGQRDHRSMLITMYSSQNRSAWHRLGSLGPVQAWDRRRELYCEYCMHGAYSWIDQLGHHKQGVVASWTGQCTDTVRIQMHRNPKEVELLVP